MVLVLFVRLAHVRLVELGSEVQFGHALLVSATVEKKCLQREWVVRE